MSDAPQNFDEKLDAIMEELADDVMAGRLDEKPTERVAAIKSLVQYAAFKNRKNRGAQRPGSGLQRYNDMISGKESANGDARS